MRIAHASDIHLGFRAGTRVTPAARNQREQDVSDAFAAFVDGAVAAKPDLVLIAGDMFHRPNPGNLPIRDAARGVKKLLSAGLDVLIVEGNHDGPTVEEGATGTPLLALAPLGARIIRRAERLHFPALDCEILCVPDRDLRGVALVPGQTASTQLLLAHGSIGGRLAKLPGVDVLPAEVISPDFTYAALGDYHSLERVAKNAWYSGSTEFTSSDPWREIKSPKGWLLVDTVAGTVEHQAVTTRRHIDLPPISAYDMAAADLTAKILEQLASIDLEGAVVRQKVTDCPRGTEHAIDWREIRKATNSCLIWRPDVRRPIEITAGNLSAVLYKADDSEPEPGDPDYVEPDEPVEQFDAVTDAQVNEWLADPVALARACADNPDPYGLEATTNDGLAERRERRDAKRKGVAA